MDTSLEQMPSVQSTYTTDSVELEQMAPPQESSSSTSNSTTNPITTTTTNIMINETTNNGTTSTGYNYTTQNSGATSQSIEVNVNNIQPTVKHQDLLCLAGAVFLFTAAAVMVLNLVRD